MNPPSDPTRAPARRDGFLRAAGLGGFGFLTVVLLENLLRQPQPMPGASLDQIVDYYQGRSQQLSLSASLFVLSIPCLLLFVIGIVRRLHAASPEAESWGWVGAVAASLMTVTFGATVALDVVLNASADTLASNGALTLLTWRLKVALFTVNLVALSTALLALGRGCRIGGLGPRWLARLAALAGPIGLAAAFPIRSLVLGSAWGLVGLLPFLVWLLFVTVTSVGHLRAARTG
jgi:hypothetical protein